MENEALIAIIIFSALLAGFILGFLLRKFFSERKKIDINKFDEVKNELNSKIIELENSEKNSIELKEKADSLSEKIDKLIGEKENQSKTISMLETENKNLKEKYSEKIKLYDNINIKCEEAGNEINEKNNILASIKAELSSLKKEYSKLDIEYKELQNHYKEKQEALSTAKSEITELAEKNKNLNEKLHTQKKEIEDIGKKFRDEFQVLADKILEVKSKKFTEQNQLNIKNILDPLDQNIKEFKKRVEFTYNEEAKDRSKLQEKIKNLIELNNKLSEDATNLTNALKGSSKTQGDWGEMILENILENSGLEKNREFFIQETIKDEKGNSLRPDVIIKYPDNREIIIDSKVSLTAYEKYSGAETKEEQNKHLKQHIISVKKHINDLNSKNYSNYTKSLDFVMLFIPIEPAYLVAVKNDESLWDYAYKKRILLISPTNLIAALKLLADLWQREYQNQNAIKIADRGAKLFDKFVSLYESLESVGNNLSKTQNSYKNAMKQLKFGSGNLYGQVHKLKKLGIQPEKNLPPPEDDELNDE